MSPPTTLWSRAWIVFVVALSLPRAGFGSEYALRFHGVGQNQQDRARVALDDDVPGPDQSAPLDVGAGDFTVELWLRGTLAANPTAPHSGSSSMPGDAWLNGNMLIDRSIDGGSDREFGISVGGGRVRFGTGRADQNPTDQVHTLFGSALVLDDQWHHVACVRDATSGVVSIYVDGQLDVASAAGVSRDDLSYPNSGAPGSHTPWGPYLGIAAEKHDHGPNHPAFTGFIDELRVWNVARSPAEISAYRHWVLAPATTGLVGSYRFEEGNGTALADSSAAASPTGELIAGAPGNGEWVAAAADPKNTAPVTAGPLPPGFGKGTLTTDLNQPTTLVFAPDGRLFIGERVGDIHLFKNGKLVAQPVLSLPVSTQNGERGLLGLTLDPDFAQSGHLYAYYTTPEPRNRVSRFTVVGDTINPASEFVVWQNTQLAGTSHHGGGIQFGSDGHLYIATGDQFNSANSQNLGNQHGKILRVAKDGATPLGNPFVGVPGADPLVYAYGLRNPFRLRHDPPTGRIWVGDVGGNSATAYEEINLLLPGRNYGWPDQEGAGCYIPSCDGIEAPYYAWRHDDPAYVPGQSQGAVIAGVVYRGDAFPQEYRGNLIVGDFANNWIRRLILADDGTVLADPLFLAAPEGKNIADYAVGNDGALYYVSVGTVPHQSSQGEGALHWIYYYGDGNAPPQPQLSADVTQGVPPFTVHFSSNGTTDPDQGPGAITYLWNFGDGATSTAADPSHTYTTAGPMAVTLIVSDQLDQTTSPPLLIQSGNPPVATILSPPDGLKYKAGDLVFFNGKGSDVEDGALAPTKLTWQVFLIHAEHSHPFYGPVKGAAGAFVIPLNDHPPEDTYYEIRLSVLDSDGLSDERIIALKPRPSTLVFDSVPPGVAFTLDGQPEVTPRVYESLVGYQHLVEAPHGVTIDGIPHEFVCWSHGVAASHTLTAPVGGLNVTAFYAPAPAIPVAASVAAADRNAQYDASTGQQYGDPLDPLSICAGATGPTELGVQFTLPIPNSATILAAHLELVSAGGAGAPVITLRGYDVGDAPPFVVGATTSLGNHAPLTSSQVSWTPPLAPAGTVFESVDVSTIVQEIVDRPNWISGNRLGLVALAQGSPGDARCVRNFASGQPPRLVVSYAGAPSQPCSAACGFRSYGAGPASTHVLGLVGSGKSSAGGFFKLSAYDAPVGAAELYLFGSTDKASLPVFGGTLLVEPLHLLFFLTLPTQQGEADLTLYLPDQPATVGLALRFQAAAPSPSALQGYVFSNGLELLVCP